MSDLMAMLLRSLARWAGIQLRPPDRPEPAPDPVPMPAPDPEPAPPTPPPDVPSGLVAAINQARATNGLPALVEDPTLDRSAAAWAGVMASGQGLGHGDFAARIAACFPDSPAGEDVAEGQPTDDAVVAAWMESPPHRANIVGDFSKVGSGSARDAGGLIYWCVDFVGEG